MKHYLFLLLSLALLLLGSCKKESTPSTSASKVSLGQQIFLDKNLSTPVGQSCSSCHSPEVAFTDPNHNVVSPGAVSGLFGNRNAPTISYAMYSPVLHYSDPDTGYAGGMFLDGRVNTLQEQAQKPFLNPLEMGNPNMQAVVSKVQAASYYPLYQQIYGNITDVSEAFYNISDALASFEQSPAVNPFTSKFDYYMKGQATLTPQEMAGYILFQDTIKGRCANCHLNTPDPVSGKILFTDHTYNSDGVPKNPNLPYYAIPASYNPQGSNYVDIGLGDFVTTDPTQDGAFKVPTLRNVALTSPYFHNGVFTTLEKVVHFYNTRDSLGSGFAPAEVNANIDSTDFGNLHMSATDEANIVAFLKTLTDGYAR